MMMMFKDKFECHSTRNFDLVSRYYIHKETGTQVVLESHSEVGFDSTKVAISARFWDNGKFAYIAWNDDENVITVAFGDDYYTKKTFDSKPSNEYLKAYVQHMFQRVLTGMEINVMKDIVDEVKFS